MFGPPPSLPWQNPNDEKEAEQPLIQVYPNPVIDRLHVVSEGNSTLQVIDMLGRFFMKRGFSDEIELTLSFLKPGTYFVLVNEQAFRVMKL